MDVSKKLKAERKKAGLTQKDLADRMECSFITISRYENGERQPSVSTLQQIADALGVPVTVFFDTPEDTEENDAIAELSVNAQASPALQKTIKLLNGLNQKQLMQVLLFLEALTDDPQK